MGWSGGLDRFMMGDRRRMPRWKFQPATQMANAFHLLEQVAHIRMRAACRRGWWLLGYCMYRR
jgi:hypothetical protein